MARAVALFALALAACGARTPLGASGHADASPDANPPSEAGAPSCAWTVAGAAVRVSSDPVEVPGDVQFVDAVPTTGGALAAWTTPGGIQDAEMAVARRVAYDLTSNGNEYVVLRAPSVVHVLDDLALGNGSGHVAVTAFDGTACVFRPLTVDGAPNGAAVHVGPQRCIAAAATPSGFDLLLREGQGVTSLALLVQSVTLVGVPTTAPLQLVVESSPIVAARRATLRDGSFIVAAALRNGRVVARAFSSHGAPLGPEQLIAVDPALVDTIVAVAPVTGGAILAWVTLAGQSGRVRAVSVDPRAHARGAGVTLTVSSLPITALDLEPDATGGAVLAWTEHSSSSSNAKVLGLSPSAASRGAPIAVAAPTPGASFAPSIRVVTESDHGLVLFEASSSTTPHRVWAAPLSCAP